MLGESKKEIYQLIPPEYIPLTQKFSLGTLPKEVLDWIQSVGLSFPVLFKPDIGERGWMVKKIHSPVDVEKYLQVIRVDFLAQEYVSFPIEIGLFYHRFPGSLSGTISSITRKSLMQVIGNGVNTVKELLMESPRGRLYMSEFEAKYPDKLTLIPSANELVEVEPIGNHCRGTVFLDDTHRITKDLELAFDKIASEIPGFHFGRFDLRCQSYKDLSAGKNFKILELNGAGAEPGHIYQPGRSIWKGYADILHHLSVLCNIAIQNHQLGIPYTSLKEGLTFMKKIRKYNQQKGL